MIFKLAWRSLWRNKRRTIITILAVAFAVLLSVFMRGLQQGTYAVNIRSAVEVFSGYMQVQKEGYQKNPSLQKSFPYTAKLQKILNDEALINGYAPRITGAGLISYQQTSLGALILAIDPAKERNVSKLMEKLNAGQFFVSDSSAEIVIGYKMLQNLKAELGDDIVILAQGFDGSLGNMRYKIVGTFKTGSAELDRDAIIMGLSTAQDLLAMYSRINALALALSGLDDIEAVSSHLTPLLTSEKLVVLPWNKVMPNLQQMIEMDNIGGVLFLSILVSVVAFGILNTLIMSITERFKEFGVMLAIGMPNKQLLVQVFWETLFIAGIGVIVGNILGLLLNGYIVANPIIIGGEFAEMYEEYGFLPRLESSLAPAIFLKISIMIFGISILAGLYPLIKVFRLAPLKGIRHT